MMKQVADYQLENPTPHHSKSKNFPMGWVPASFYTGVLSTWYATGDVKYLEAARSWAERNHWRAGPRFRHADDLACGQTYLELHLIDPAQANIKPITARFDSLMADPKPGREDWWWCDALFMAPPAFARLAKATNDYRYLNYMHEMFWDATAFLFDKTHHLYYRDERYFSQVTKSGQKVFWSRGNGWVMAGIARILEYLPDSDRRKSSYVDLIAQMAQAVVQSQGDDGFWRASLLDAQEHPKPESSGTAFFCYALAYGINKGYLDKNSYLPAVKKAWQALVSAVHPDGKMGWVQRIGHNPDDVNFDDTHAYGAGGFLLAGSEVLKLDF
ncbi:MAG: glycoside hydrolase family 88 protein [Calditrichales bacterium]|nr:MAG: glycoside hydrolase family 88 protein [Calditrichales bacterium]